MSITRLLGDWEVINLTGTKNPPNKQRNCICHQHSRHQSILLWNQFIWYAIGLIHQRMIWVPVNLLLLLKILLNNTELNLNKLSVKIYSSKIMHRFILSAEQVMILHDSLICVGEI